MKIWVDDVRPAPDGYVWCKTVRSAAYVIKLYERRESITLWECNIICNVIACYDIEYIGEFEDYLFDEKNTLELIDIDHDAGEYSYDGGDYIEILNWLEETGRNYPIRIHSMNPVGVENMRRIINRNGWKEIR